MVGKERREIVLSSETQELLNTARVSQGRSENKTDSNEHRSLLHKRMVESERESKAGFLRLQEEQAQNAQLRQQLEEAEKKLSLEHIALKEIAVITPITGEDAAVMYEIARYVLPYERE